MSRDDQTFDRYRCAVTQVEILRCLASFDPSCTAPVNIELCPARSARNDRSHFDLRVSTNPETLTIIFLRPGGDELLAWLRGVALLASEQSHGTRWVLVHAEETAATRTLRSVTDVLTGSALTRPAGTDDALATAMVRELDGGLRGIVPRLRVDRRPPAAEERFARTVARHLCRDSAQATTLLQAVRAMATAAEDRRGQLLLSDLRHELDSRNIALETLRDLDADLRADVLRRAGNQCCACQRGDGDIDVRLLNELPADHDPDNLAALCDSCWAACRPANTAASTLQIVRLTRLRREWDWEVARQRREAASRQQPRPSDEIVALHNVLCRHLIGDFHWDGPRRGEFAKLGGRMEDRFYQSNRGERLTARPAYYHTYWGLVGSKLLVPDVFPEHAEVAANAVADRLSATGWITVDLEDYAAPPSVGRRRVQTIRHTARAAMILLLADHHHDIAAEVAWNLLAEAELSTKYDGGWGEFRDDPTAASSLYSSLYALQLLCSACLDPHWSAMMPEWPRFVAEATGVIRRTWRYMAGQWRADRWSMSGMPWIVNTAAILADIGIYTPPTLAAEIHRTLRDALNPAGRLAEPAIGADWDAPEPVLSVRVAFAAGQLACAAGDERLAQLRKRLLRMPWADVPLRTMDVAFLALLSTRIDHGGRVPVGFTDAELERLVSRSTDSREGPSTTRPARVFVSYVREDGAAVHPLAAQLRAAGIEVWLDRDNLEVGLRWKDAIREAIRGGDYFLAFFSPAYADRRRTYMNEELAVAIEELRLRPRHRRWFLPVTSGPDLVPDIPIGPGETLRDIQAVSLADDRDRTIARLIAAMTSPE